MILLEIYQDSFTYGNFILHCECSWLLSLIKDFILVFDFARILFTDINFIIEMPIVHFICEFLSHHLLSFNIRVINLV